MNQSTILEAVEILEKRKGAAMSKLQSLLAGDADRTSDSSRVARDIVSLCDQAGVGPEFLKSFTAPRPPAPKKKAHLALEMNLLPTGCKLTRTLYVDDLCRGSATVDISGYEFVEAGGQSAEELKQLIATINDFNSGVQAKCDEGIALLKRVGIGGGIAGLLSAIVGEDRRRQLLDRFKLWQIRKAVAEAILIKSRKATQPIDELFLCRLGLGGWIPPVLTGNHSPQSA